MFSELSKLVGYWNINMNIKKNSINSTQTLTHIHMYEYSRLRVNKIKLCGELGDSKYFKEIQD